MPKPVEKRFGKRLRECRHNQGWSLRVLSKKCGLTIAFLSDIENGKRGIGLGNAVKLANVFGYGISEFLHPEIWSSEK